MALNLFGRVVQKATDFLGAGDNSVGMNARRDLRIAASLPPKTELVRLGFSYVTQTLTASAVVAGAFPTTRGDFLMYNNEPGAGKAYVIDSVFAICTTSSAAGDNYSLVGQIAGPGAVAKPTAVANIVTSMSGKGTGYPGNAVFGAGVTTAVANQWFSIGSASGDTVLTATIGASLDYEVQGQYIIQPTGSLFVSVINSVAGTAKFNIGVRWHELQLDLA